MRSCQPTWKGSCGKVSQPSRAIRGYTHIRDEDLADAAAALHAHSWPSAAVSCIATAAAEATSSASAAAASGETRLSLAVLNRVSLASQDRMESSYLTNVDQPAHKRRVAQSVDGGLRLLSRGILDNSVSWLDAAIRGSLRSFNLPTTL